MKKLLGALCLVFFCAIAVTPSFAAKKPTPVQVAPPVAPDELGEYHAILIGINGYKSFNKLKTPVGDVKALADILKNQYGFSDVVTLTDETKDKPTAINILKYIREKAGSLTDKDNLLVYYAGHGSLDELTSAGYWIPINGVADDTATWISHDQIKSLLETNRIAVKNFLLVTDSCYSSGMHSIEVYPDVRKRGMDADAIQQELLRRGSLKSREVITSGGVEPMEDVVPGSNHSLFAHYFLQALRENNNRYIDIRTLLREKVVPEIRKWGKQTPEVVRSRTVADENGLFILVKAGVADPKDERIRELITIIKPLEQEIKAQKDKQEKVEKELKQWTESREELLHKNSLLHKEIASLQEQQKKVEVDLKQVTNSRTDLLVEIESLNKVDKENKDVVRTLRAALEQKDKMPKVKIAVIEKEIQRTDDLGRQIQIDKEKLDARARSITDIEARLNEQQSKLNAYAEEQRRKIASLERSKLALEGREKMLDQQLQNAKENIEVAILTLMTIDGEEGSTARFIVLDNIVFDKKSKLIWTIDANMTKRMDYESAQNYVSEMNYAGYNDWRIPSIEEWRELIPGKGIKEALPEGYPFKHVLTVGYYWVAKTKTSDLPSAINLGNGSVTRLNKNITADIWPVRDPTPDEIVKFYHK